MTLKDEIWSDLKDVEADLGKPIFTWDNQDYFCVPSMNEELLTLERGGFQVQKVLNLTVRSNQFPDGVIPQSQDILSYRNENFGVANAKLDATGAILELICVSDTRGS